MIQRNHCSKQYIGETKGRLKDRFNEHRRPVDNLSNISKPTTVSVLSPLLIPSLTNRRVDSFASYAYSCRICPLELVLLPAPKKK